MSFLQNIGIGNSIALVTVFLSLIGVLVSVLDYVTRSKQPRIKTIGYQLEDNTLLANFDEKHKSDIEIRFKGQLQAINTPQDTYAINKITFTIKNIGGREITLGSDDNAIEIKFGPHSKVLKHDMVYDNKHLTSNPKVAMDGGSLKLGEFKLRNRGIIKIEVWVAQYSEIDVYISDDVAKIVDLDSNKARNSFIIAPLIMCFGLIILVLSLIFHPISILETIGIFASFGSILLMALFLFFLDKISKIWG